MNQKQREYMVKMIEATADKQIQALKANQPSPPSLNNYILTEILEDRIEFKSPKELKAYIRQMALDVKPEEVLIKGGKAKRRGYTHYYNDDDDTTEYHNISIDAVALFVIPEAYRVRRKAYIDEMTKIQEEIDDIIANRNTLVMKINIGSNSALDVLVQQIDNIGDLKLVNKTLQLAAGANDPD